MPKLNTLRAFLLVLVVFGFVGAQDSLPELVRKVKPSVVSIITFTAKNDPLMSGSGFFIRDGEVITNLHVIEGADHAEVRTLDGKGKTLKVNGLLKTDEEADLALLSVNAPDEKPRAVEMAKNLPDEGEKIFVIGNPLRMEGTVSDGIVSAVREVPTLGNVVQITAPISNGSSGSPVFNMQGKVLGIVTIKVTNGQNINLALSSARLAALKPGPLSPIARVDEHLRPGKDQALAEWWYKSGLSSLWLGNYDSALDYFRNAVEKDPERVEAWIEVGFCMVKQGKNEEAVRALQRAIKLRPTSAEAWNKLGDAYYYATRYHEAINAYKEAVRFKPEMAEAHYNLGVTYLELGDREAALSQSRILDDLDSELNRKLRSDLRPE